jgi:hypothetical protein
MTQELIKVNSPRALSVAPEEIAAMQEAFAMNIGGGSISEFDLPRIKVNPGTALWLIPALEGEETAQRIEGVVVFARDTRVYYQSKDAGNVPPDCSSSDGITGIPRPGVNAGGACAQCPLAKWDSAQTGGGQACKQVKHLFMMRGDSMFPEIVSLPPTSLKAARQFFTRLTTQGVPYAKALIGIELEKAQNPQGKTYGKAVFRFVRRLSEGEAARAMEFHQMCQSFASRLPVDPSVAAEAA